jgi:hypothetical protein
MPLTIIDLYRKVLPGTNCGDCGFPTCMAFATMVIVEQHPIRECPHLSPETVAACEQELRAQYASGAGLKKDPAEEALQWARERSASMAIEDLPARIGGELVERDGVTALRLAYFLDSVIIRPDGIARADGSELNRWEQVFIYNHLAQGGSALPSGQWKAFGDFPNTVSKVKSMAAHVENPLIEAFKGRAEQLIREAEKLGAVDMSGKIGSADVALLFHPLPRVPVLLMFWDEVKADGFDAQVKLLFDKTVTDHLDIESILFLSERLRQLLRGEEADFDSV